MKKTSILMLLTVFVIGCSKDKTESELTGNWEAVKFTTSIPVDENLDGIKNTDLKQEMDCVSMKANFSSNRKFTLESTDITYDITIVDGKVVLTPKGCGVQNENGTWAINDASTILMLDFIVAGKEETSSLDIAIELSKNKLILKDLFFKEEDSATITYTVEFQRS